MPVVQRERICVRGALISRNLQVKGFVPETEILSETDK